MALLTTTKKLKDPAVIRLPHCLEHTSSKDFKFLCFLKAEHEDITVKGGQTIITFKQVDKNQSEFPLNSQYGILKDHHFCLYCIAKGYCSQDTKEMILKRQLYTFTIHRPTAYPRNRHQKVYGILHFYLDGCIQVYIRLLSKCY